MSEQFLGSIGIFAFNFAPVGWAMCQGQTLPISQNTALFSLLGTFYGGNGTTTFALPDLRGRLPMGAGDGPDLTPRVIGEEGGAESVTLTINNLPTHTHVITLNNLAATANAKNLAGNAQTPVGNVPAIEAAGVTATYSNLAPDSTMAAGAISLTGTPSAGLTGGNIPAPSLPPYLVLNYCIALVGIFPSRN
jgi:microcystin-dependent protein